MTQRANSVGKEKSKLHKEALSIAAKKRKRIRKTNEEKLNYLSKNENFSNSWSINRRLCLERDGYRCRHCGSNKKLEVYHVDPFRKTKNNNISNLITLCSRCHRNAEEIRLPKTSDNLCGVILAGGRGTRLYPNSFFHNKHELPMGGVPMIFHPIFTLRTLHITKVMIVLDRHHVGRIVEMLGDGSEFGMDFTYRVQNGPGGIAEALTLARNFVGNKNVYVILGDNIFNRNEFQKPFDTYTDGMVFLKNVSNPSDYGVAEIDEKRVLSVVEKPRHPKTKLAVTGLYLYKPSIFSILDSFSPSARGELEISSLNDYLAKRNQLSFKIIKGEWMDAGCSHEEYLNANLTCLKNIKND